MSNNRKQLTENDLSEPRFAHLFLRICDTSLCVFIFSPDEDNSLIYREFPLKKDSEGSFISSLEETVYENPLLLRAFGRISVLVESEKFLTIPSIVSGDSEMVEKLVSETLTDFSPEDETLLTNDIANLNIALVNVIPNRLYAFINRAFNNPIILSHLSPLLTYFSDRRRHGNTARLFVNIRPEAMDIFAFSYEQLTACNIISFRSISDAIFYVLTYREKLGLTDSADRILVCGESVARKKLIVGLRKFVPDVMPVIFPSSVFRLGNHAIDAPFELSALQLCE